MIKKIGVLTSGGDAPGMNAAIRGVVRSALTEGLEVMGIYDGYLGLYEDRMVQLDRYSVSDMINRGGTFLGSARFPEFRDENIRAVAIENLKKRGIDALVVIGGDAPGMNAAIRGVVRSALTEGLEVMGIYDGYLGLYEDRMVQLDRYSVSDMINRGGTFLGSARFPEFRDENIRAVAIENLKKRGIDALVVIGGDGSYMGAMRLTEMGFPCIGLPGTIDNDIKGTDYTIGFFTALSTVVEAIDRLRDTSSSHQRISVVEVMGRYCGDLTLAAAIAGGCEFVVVPEVEFSREDLVNEIKAGIAKGKKHAIVAITEHMCDVDELAHFIEKETGRETRATVLGHIQRGGSPVPYDRILASRMGAYAIDLLLAGYGGRCVGIQNEQLVHHDIIDAIENMKRPFKGDWLDCAKKLY